MTVAVPFHLRRLPDAKPAAGLLLESSSVETLLAVCAPLRHVTIFAIHGGFLLLADEFPEAVSEGVKLRRLSENGYLPVDAELLPALSTAEAADLTRRQGLVFLPGGRLLSFDPAAGRKPTDFLQLPPVRRSRWRAFPDPELPAPEITLLQRLIPPPPDGEVIAQDGPPIGDGDPRPADTSFKNKVLGKSTHALGSGLGGLGKLLGLQGLKDLGKKLKDKGIEMAPRITESILGQQEAALQDLLRRFKGGNIDDALRRAVPISSEPGRGSRAYTGTGLPTNNIGFSLGNLFGGSGASSLWQGGNPETWHRLTEEYRRAAREAVQRGDYRRAAVIHAKLLGDIRAAAEVLSQGGLHRESAILFRDKVADLARAAREFRSAGDHDEALRLYRKMALYELSGDLLRELGEEERAVAEYHRAAEEHVRKDKDYLRAGEVMLRKTGRADLAGAYFSLGWQQRTQLTDAGAMACGHRLLEIYAFALPREAFWNHITEAEHWLFGAQWAGRTAEVATFFNKLADLGELPHLKDERPAIRDKARVMLGQQLRSHADHERTPGNAVSALFGQGSQWKPDMVSDATFALRSFLKSDTRPVKPKRELRHVRIRNSAVVALAHAPETGQLFLSFEDGAVIRYDPRNSSTHRIKMPDDHEETIVSLSTDTTGSLLAGIQSSMDIVGVIRSWEIDPAGPERTVHVSLNLTGTRLLPVTTLDDGLPGVAFSSKECLSWYHLPSLVLSNQDNLTERFEFDLSTLHLVLRIPYETWGYTLGFDGKTVKWDVLSVHVGWEPAPLPSSGRTFVNLSWAILNSEEALLAGIDADGVLYRTVVQHHPEGTLTHQTYSHTTPGGYRGVAVGKAGRVAAVTFSNQVVWLRADAAGRRMLEAAPPVQLSSIYRPVGCFLSPSTDELIVVMGSGEAFHVPMPG